MGSSTCPRFSPAVRSGRGMAGLAGRLLGKGFDGFVAQVHLSDLA